MALALPGGGGDALRAAVSAACLAACRAAQGADPRGPPRLPSAEGAAAALLAAPAAEIGPRGLASRTPGLDALRTEAVLPRTVGTARTIFPAFIVDFAIG